MSDRNLMRAAQQAIREGRKREARDLLHQVLQERPDEHRAWLWLAGITSSPRASLEYVNRAQRLKPDDPTVRKARAWAKKKLAEEETASPPPPVAKPKRAEATPAPAPAGADVVERLRPAGPEADVSEPAPSRRRAWAMPLAVMAVLALVVVVSGFALTGRGGLGRAPAGAGQPTAAGYQFEPNPAGADVSLLKDAPTATRPGLATKPITGDAGGQPRPTWTVTPAPTNTPRPTPTVAPTFTTDSGDVVPPANLKPGERWVDVDLGEQTLVAYEGLTPVFETLVSSGVAQHPTVTGQFRIWLRYEAQTMDGRLLGYDYYLEDVPYVMYFFEDYALHGTYWHDNFGTPMSHGCVNLETSDAEWIFNWSSIGTLVNVHY